MTQWVAGEIKLLYEEISPLIEGYTSGLCPQCSEVCCRQRHLKYDDCDRLFIRSFGIEIEEIEAHDMDACCVFLSEGGCILPRWQRPFRCTWFFCDPLIEEVQGNSVRELRRMVKLVRDIQTLRRRCLNHMSGTTNGIR